MFKKDFNKNPGYALSWSISVFEVTARRQEAQGLLYALKKNKNLTIEKIKNFLKEEIILGARCPKRSSSPTSNIWDECTTSAKARILDLIERGF